MNELISVIVPVYNAQNYLEECLESILNQTYKNIEIICVNDCSTDESLKIIKKYMEIDKRIILINKEKNEGVTFARNDAYKICKGNYICNVDSDDFLKIDSIEETYNFLKKENLEISLFDSYYFWNIKNMKKINTVKNGTILNGKDAFLKTLDWKIALNGLYKKYIIMENFDEKYFNGDELASRKRILKCQKIGVSRGKYFYRQYEYSLTKKFTVRKFEMLLSNIEMKKVIKKDYPEILKKFEVKTLSTLIDFLELYLKYYEKISEKDKIKVKQIIEIAVKNLDLKNVRNYYILRFEILKYYRKKRMLKRLLNKI